MKWDTTEPTERQFQLRSRDDILSFAQAHGIKTRGHTFVWHDQVPEWVFQDANGVDISTEPFMPCHVGWNARAERHAFLESMA